MKRASVRDLHIHTSTLVRDAAAGNIIVIENRGQPVAELRPLKKQPSKRFPNRDKYLSKFPKVSGDTGRMLEEERS